MEKGYYLTEGGKLTNPDFGYEKTGNYSKVSGNAFDVYFAEEERIEEIEDRKVASGSQSEAVAGHGTY